MTTNNPSINKTAEMTKMALYIFEKLKSKYGRYVNVQGIIPGVEFENPIIDLEKSEKYYSEYPSPWD